MTVEIEFYLFQYKEIQLRLVGFPLLLSILVCWRVNSVMLRPFSLWHLWKLLNWGRLFGAEHETTEDQQRWKFIIDYHHHDHHHQHHNQKHQNNNHCHHNNNNNNNNSSNNNNKIPWNLTCHIGVTKQWLFNWQDVLLVESDGYLTSFRALPSDVEGAVDCIDHALHVGLDSRLGYRQNRSSLQEVERSEGNKLFRCLCQNHECYEIPLSNVVNSSCFIKIW